MCHEKNTNEGRRCITITSRCFPSFLSLLLFVKLCQSADDLSTSVLFPPRAQFNSCTNSNQMNLPFCVAVPRLLADAKYLHQKLSALKNVAPPSGMLVTVVSEKSIPRTGPSSPTPVPRSSNALSSANQRLKGLLSGKSGAFDKSHSTGVRSSSLAPAPAPSPVVSSPPLNGASSPPPQVRKLSVGGSDAGPVGQGGKTPEKGGMTLKGENQTIQGQRRTLSPVLPPTPHDTPPTPEPVRPDADTEPEAQRVLNAGDGSAGTGDGGDKVELELELDMDMEGGEGEGAQMDGVLGGSGGRAALETDLAPLDLEGRSEPPQAVSPPLSSEASPPADGVQS